MRYHNLLKSVLLAISLLGVPTVSLAQGIETKRVQFDTGRTGTVLGGTITGDQIVDYVLGASSGQRMTVSMNTNNPSAYFNVMPAGDPQAIHIGSTSGLSFDGVLPRGGDWVIRVYLMRSAARRGESATYSINVGVTGGSPGSTASGSSGPEGACRDAVISVTNTSDVSVVSSEFSQAGTMVRLAVGPGRAPWQCIGYADGSTGGVMFVGNDSAGVSASPAPDYADGNSGGPDWWQVTGASRLNVRSGPGTDRAILGKVAEGQRVRNLGCSGLGAARWCNVEVDGGAYRGWVSGRYLTESGAPTASGSTAPVIAESAAMGPNFWEVTGVPAGDTLNVRTGIGTSNPIVARAPNGVIFRNLGCEGGGSSRWCQVETRDGGTRGWVSGAYLRESGGPAAVVTTPETSSSADVGTPELAVRPTGEIELRWATGCTILYNPRGQRIQTGGTCSDRQIGRSDDATARHLRER